MLGSTNNINTYFIHGFCSDIFKRFITKHLPYLNNQPKSDRKYRHLYITPVERDNAYPTKKIVINKRDINPFNTATFFIILQLMILIYVPMASLLAPYYENDRHTSHANHYHYPQLASSQEDHEFDSFNQLESKIVGNYTSLPSFINGRN